MGKGHKKDKQTSAQKKSAFWSSLLTQQQKKVREGLTNTGIEAQTRNQDGLTSIMVAAANGKHKSLEILLDWYQRRRLLRPKGWINLTDDEGKTALMMAAARSHIQCMEVLMEHSANLFMKDANGRTARDHAVEWKKTEAVKLIDEFLRESEDEEEVEGENHTDGLTSTQRSKLKKRMLQKQERRGAKDVEKDDGDSDSSEDDGSTAPEAVWDEVKKVIESHEMLRGIHEISVVRETPESFLPPPGVDPALWYLKSINRLELSLAPNVLTYIPGQELRRLRNLQTLILNRNSLGSLPTELGKLKELKVLEVADNQLTALPDSISQLKNLELVNVASNQLTTVSNLQLEALTTLNVSNNKLTALELPFETIKRTRNISCSDNMITSISSKIALLTNLVDFVGENNKIKEVPTEITALKKVKQLKLDGNPIKDSKVVKMLKQDGKGMKDLWKYLTKTAKKKSARDDASTVDQRSQAQVESSEGEDQVQEELDEEEESDFDSDDSFDITMEEL